MKMSDKECEFDIGKMPNSEQLEKLQMPARVLRARSLRDIAQGTGRAFGGLTTVAKALLITGTIGAVVAFVTPEQAYAGERMASTDPAAVDQADNAALAAFGLEISTINESVDLGSLWRAVREVVLTKRVSDHTQQLIWRRVWRLDPSFAYNDGLDSDGPDLRAPETAPVVATKKTGIAQ